jgi:hypothetical protein
MTDSEEGRLQPTPAGHPKGELLSTGYKSFQNFFIFYILGLKFGTHLQEPIAPRFLFYLAL